MRSVLAVLALCAVACGGAGPLQPSPEEVPFIVRSARDGTPLVGATVTVQGVGVLVSDTRGIVPLEARYEGAIVEIAPPSGMERFLAPRQFVFRMASVPKDAKLWPKDAALTEEQTFALIYGNASGNPLYRPQEHAVCVMVQPEIWTDKRVATVLPRAMETLNAADDDVDWRMCERSSPGSLATTVRLDPLHEVFLRPENKHVGAFAALYLDKSSTVIERAEVVFKCFDCYLGDHLERAFTHELVHVRGLRDTNATHGGMMGSPEAVLAFAPWEKEAMRYAFLRPPGNRWPDNSAVMKLPGARSTLETGEPLIIVE